MTAPRVDPLSKAEIAARRSEPREYRKTATVMAGQAHEAGIIPTLEGDHSYEAGDYIAGPGQAGEYWPVKQSIFEATYALATLDRAGRPDDEFVALAARYRAEHEATHGEPEQCGGPCIVLGLDEPLDQAGRSGGETWRCPSCHDTTAPMGMCAKCGVFGTRQEDRR